MRFGCYLRMSVKERGQNLFQWHCYCLSNLMGPNMAVLSNPHVPLHCLRFSLPFFPRYRLHFQPVTTSDNSVQWGRLFVGFLKARPIRCDLFMFSVSSSYWIWGTSILLYLWVTDTIHSLFSTSNANFKRLIIFGYRFVHGGHVNEPYSWIDLTAAVQNSTFSRYPNVYKCPKNGANLQTRLASDKQRTSQESDRL